MNLIESERLVRKIIDVLQNRLPGAQARALAQPYADACQAVNHRLTQCAAMLAQGDEHQALQLAEAPPPVLELASRLAFRESEDWRQFCHKHDLPIPDPLEGAAIRQINAAYGKGISADHALYRDYRQAVLLHQDDLAVKALRSISWRNAADANAPRELERLERKILRGRLEEIEAALRAGDQTRVVALVEATEALDFQLRPGGEIWREAQRTRCHVLLLKTADCRRQEHWQEAAVYLSELRSLAAEHELQLEPADTQQATTLETWIAECHKREVEDERFARAITELRQMLAQNEELQVSGELPGRLELRDRLELLRHKWRELEIANRPMGEDLHPRVTKLLLLFETRLARLERRRRAAALATLAAFVVIALAQSFFFWNRRQARDLSSELASLVAHQQVTALEQRIAQLRNQPARLARSKPVVEALASAEAFLGQMRQKREALDLSLNRLQSIADHNFTELAPDQTQVLVNAIDEAVETMPKDYQPALRARFMRLQSRWESWLDTQRNARAARFTDGLRQVNETATRELRYGRGPEAVRITLAALGPKLTELQQLAFPPVARLALPVDLQAQLQALRQRVQAFTAELEKWDQVQTAWRVPGSLEGYLESLKQLQRCDFAEPLQVRAAGEVLSLNVSTQALLSALVLPAPAQSYAQSHGLPELRLRPDDVMPGERTRIRDLRDDENIHNVRLYRRTLRLAPEGQANRVRTVYLRGQWDNTRSTLQRGMIYDPGDSPTELAFRRQEAYSEVLFEEIGRAPEAQAFESVGAQRLLDTSSTNYGGSILVILDQINRDASSSPVFRAWLFLRLCELMDLRPNEWGAPWAPALAADRQHLHSLGADSLRSGDWLVPARQQTFCAALEEHFTGARKTSYADQAHFLHELARRADEAGFTLAGHVDSSGQAVQPGEPAAGAELWGWAADTRMPALLFRSRGPTAGFESVNRPLAFSPLLQLRADPRQLVGAVKQTFGSLAPQVGAWLPPLFASHE